MPSKSRQYTGEPSRQRPHDRNTDTELRICGVNACKAVFAHRREDIIRAYVTEEQAGQLTDLLRWCASRRKAYHIVPPEEMEKITHSVHHEGVCLLTKPCRYMSFETFKERIERANDPCCVLMLDRIVNPHNLGAIVRVAAHFGVQGILQHGDSADLPNLSGAVYRTAEGGLEQVPIIRLNNPVSALKWLRDVGFAVMATSSHVTRSVYESELSRRLVLLLGSEAEGLDRSLADLADIVVSIPGTGQVESLNVACATAVLLGEFWRRMHL